MDAYAEQIQEAYQRGIVITVVDPEAVDLASWCASKGMVYPGVPIAPNPGGKGNLLISFNRDLLPAGQVECSGIELKGVPDYVFLLIPPSRKEGMRI